MKNIYASEDSKALAYIHNEAIMKIIVKEY